MEGLQVLPDEPRFGLAARDNLRAAIWRDAPTLPQIHARRDASMAHARGGPDGTGFVDLIVSGTPRFSDDGCRTRLDTLGFESTGGAS